MRPWLGTLTPAAAAIVALLALLGSVSPVAASSSPCSNPVLHQLFKFNASYDTRHYAFELNLCDAALPSSCGSHSSACVQARDPPGAAFVSIGAATSLPDSSDESNALVLSLGLGDTCAGMAARHRTSVRLVCDVSEADSVRWASLFTYSAADCSWLLMGWSSLACPAMPGPADVELLAAIAVTRHGDRAPIFSFPDDPTVWPEGPAQLTGRGMRQHYELGARLRRRYVDRWPLLDATYNFSQVSVRATDVDRTIASAIAQLAGLYPAGTGPVDSPRAQPFIPVHSVPADSDSLLRAFDNCARYRSLEHSRTLTPEWQDKAREIGDFVAELEAATRTRILLEQWYILYDPLFAQHEHALPLCAGRVSESQYARVIDIADWQNGHVFAHDELSHLAGGNLAALIGDTLASLATAANGAHARYTLYSGHDTTVAPLLAVMPIVYDGKLVPYAANVIFELVRVRGSTATHVIMLYLGAPVSVRGCEAGPYPGSCTLPSFAAAMRAAAVPDWTLRCSDTYVAPPGQDVRDAAVRRAIFLVVVAVMCVTFLVGTALWLYYRSGLFDGTRFERRRLATSLELDWAPSSDEGATADLRGNAGPPARDAESDL